MTGRFWLAFMAIIAVVGGVAVLAVMGLQSRVGGGSEAAREIEERLRDTAASVAAAEPPLRVFAMMPEGAGGRWRWKVEATLHPGVPPGDPAVSRVVERILFHCLRTPVGGGTAGGVLVVLHRPGGPDWTRAYDGQGNPR